MTNFENKGQYVLMSPTEAYSLESYLQGFQEVAEYCAANGLTKVLGDIRGVQENIPTFDRYELGVALARILGGRIQFALLAPSAIIDKTGENSAVNRGGNVFVTDSLEEALRWLEVT
jgi:hypothetical protein